MKIFVGKRESDILTYNIFNITITRWGSNDGNNYAFDNLEKYKDSTYVDWITEVLDKLTKNIEEFELHFYNQDIAHKVIKKQPKYKSYIKNLNLESTIDQFNNKTECRKWLGDFTKVIPYQSLLKEECSYSNLCRLFPEFYQFIIQENYSGGGEGTYKLNKETEQSVQANLEPKEQYLVSPFYEVSNSYSTTLLVSKDNICILPVSIQNIIPHNNKFYFAGNTFANIPTNIKEKIYQLSKIIGDKIRTDKKYRGICGIDFIESNEEIFPIEINPRYLGSSYVINKALNDSNLPSLFELNTRCFENKLDNELTFKLENLSIPYEHHYVFSFNNTNNIDGEKFYDGYDEIYLGKYGEYLYRYITHL
ncbi:MAG: hypothetical protein ATN36_06745 [Epulopiscium sp. Nele67-Bin005]|nr:MAG: hypothetical protein ATN36_06745 [Epulopiscium sp. Nele67-Bin005]